MKRIIFTNGFKEIDVEGWRYLYLLPNIVIIDHKKGAFVIRFIWLWFHIDILLKNFNKKE